VSIGARADQSPARSGASKQPFMLEGTKIRRAKWNYDIFAVRHRKTFPQISLYMPIQI